MMRHSSARRVEPRQTYRDAHHVSAVFDRVVISYSIAEPNKPYMNDWGSTIEDLVRTYPRGIGALIVIDSSARPPSEGIRGDIKLAIARAAPHLRGLAQVVEGTGFVAAAKRSALSLISLVARFPFPIKIFASRREAVIWLLDKLAESSDNAGLDTVTVDELVDACDSVCRLSKLS